MKHKPIISKSFQITVIAMLVLCLLVISFLTYGYMRNKRHYKDIYNKKGKLVYLTYGLPKEAISANAQWVIANKWGFTYKGVAGCIVNNELADSVQVHNDIVSTVLTKKFGENWNNKFDKEVVTELRKEQAIIALVKKEKYIINTEALLHKDGNGLQFTLDPVIGTLYNVTASGWDMRAEKPRWVIYYKLSADYSLNKIVVISDKTLKK